MLITMFLLCYFAARKTTTKTVIEGTQESKPEIIIILLRFINHDFILECVFPSEASMAGCRMRKDVDSRRDQQRQRLNALTTSFFSLFLSAVTPRNASSVRACAHFLLLKQ